MWQVHVTYLNDKWHATEFDDYNDMLKYLKRQLLRGDVKRITCTDYV